VRLDLKQLYYNNLWYFKFIKARDTDKRFTKEDSKRIGESLGIAADSYDHHVTTNTWTGTNILPADYNHNKPGLDH
jgi:hypothetical protein